MKKPLLYLLLIIMTVTAFTGCAGDVTSKTASISVIYGITAAISLIILITYCAFIKQIHPWYLLLLISVFVVNTGYFCLSTSNGLQEALFANRISYLGSVFLPYSMLMITAETSKLKPKKWVKISLFILAIVMFLLAASPGYCELYYKEVSFKVVEGASTLVKVYGPLHMLYMVYLLAYFLSSFALTLYAQIKKLLDSVIEAIMLIGALFINIGLWGLEQFIDMDFEVLSVSYIISELFLLGLHVIANEYRRLKDESADAKNQDDPARTIDVTQYDFFLDGIKHLTATENKIFTLYTEGKNTAFVLQSLNIKENTLKFHNKNIYSKLGVSSRKELLEIHKILQSTNLKTSHK